VNLSDLKTGGLHYLMQNLFDIEKSKAELVEDNGEHVSNKTE